MISTFCKFFLKCQGTSFIEVLWGYSELRYVFLKYYVTSLRRTLTCYMLCVLSLALLTDNTAQLSPRATVPSLLALCFCLYVGVEKKTWLLSHFYSKNQDRTFCCSLCPFPWRLVDKSLALAGEDPTYLQTRYKACSYSPLDMDYVKKNYQCQGPPGNLSTVSDNENLLYPERKIGGVSWRQSFTSRGAEWIL